MAHLLGLNARFWPAITLCLIVAIAVLSLTPDPDLSGTGFGNDKIRHFLSYGALAGPVALARPRGWLWLLLGFAAFSAAIEVVQPLANRHMHFADFLANVAGLSMGTLAAALLRLLARRGAVRSR